MTSQATEFVELDWEFHHTIARAGGNVLLLALLEGLTQPTIRMRIWRGLSIPGVLARTLDEHEAIVDALEIARSRLGACRRHRPRRRPRGLDPIPRTGLEHARRTRSPRNTKLNSDPAERRYRAHARQRPKSTARESQRGEAASDDGRS